MEAKELRKGNYVTQDGEFIKGISTNSIHKFDMKQIVLEPIPLTEEWLVKLGFLKGQKHIIGDKYTYWNHGLGIDHVIDNRFSIRSEYKTQLVLLVHHIHELQNLFYTLFKKELEVKQ